MKKISEKNLKHLNKLVSIAKIRRVIEILRDPEGGCPWDLKQNYNSIAPYSIEEAYELVNAIEQKNVKVIKSELGYIRLQVVLISQIASDQGDFDFDDVANEISQKIIRRHPQIFDTKYKMNDLPQDSWERIKNLEKSNKKKSMINTLDQIENNMPTIIRSIKIQKKAASFNFDWINKDQVLKKVDEELDELKEALKEKNKKNIEDELGDLFFTLISLSRHLNLDPDQTLRKANQKFINRFNEMENIVEDKKLKWHSLGLIDFKNLWNNAKKIKRG